MVSPGLATTSSGTNLWSSYDHVSPTNKPTNKAVSPRIRTAPTEISTILPLPEDEGEGAAAVVDGLDASMVDWAKTVVVTAAVARRHAFNMLVGVGFEGSGGRRHSGGRNGRGNGGPEGGGAWGSRLIRQSSDGVQPSV